MMKIITTLCLVLLSVHSYSQEIIPEVETVTRDGLYEEFYENGQLSERGTYIDGEFDGLFEKFYEDGLLWVRENYRDGERDGLREFFYINGQLGIRGNYIDGKKDGLWEDFDTNGNLTKTETWENGVLVE